MTKNIYSYKRNNCRLCSSNELLKVLDVPASQPVDGFRPHSHEYLNLPRFEMDLYICRRCGHHQLLDIVKPHLLYGSYIYTSSSSPDLKLHFKKYGEYLKDKLKIDNSKNILDVGCNDGLFLKTLSKYSCNLYGIDPAPNIKDNFKDASYKFFSGYCNYENLNNLSDKFKVKSFDLITANNVFAHADNLEEMLSSIVNKLSDNGKFCFEVSYILDMVESNVIDYIYHEHLSYHGIKSLKPFLKRFGLFIYDIQRINTKGGSIRVLCTKKEIEENTQLITDFINLEVNNKCYDSSKYESIRLQISQFRNKLNDYLLKVDHNHIFSYGAAPTSIVNSLLLNYDKKLNGYLDDNPIRQNNLTPNNFIPVLSPSILSKIDKPLVIIGAWRFSEIIIPKILNINNRTDIIIPSLSEGVKFYKNK
ncbi:methyltransferase [Prochlorococcus marinus subsp. pastoris str. CCMP1986]|uniref:Methyltransferase n=1 Tax=Prochlorococcus marinus subsp. pastoris (strain CCMP1986 / NIES-2087 / MED4) TaxID=59919 RepID=Q7V0M4_PROMP|nr:class I SAM-dependent methyltransferase [Prochlorococcus marinus]KGF87205.1 hypothetical protein PROCH_0792 [Prochlorococcus marinus str. EQPAC1]CAE19691.1 methyltransferase [Prochlorococcus marinus subsp. pastoris str. CCMP1986]